jgi:uncharacterized protein
VTRIAPTNLHWSHPSDPCGTGVLVMAGSSGRIDVGRADVLARAGATAVALRWFGGSGQPEVPCEVRLETFVEVLDLLAPECDRLTILGLSYGAEAALSTAVRDSRIAAVVAMSPTDVVWEGQHLHDDDPPRSKWTWGGQPLPFVPLDRSWVPPDVPAFVEYYALSREIAEPAMVRAATIPVELIVGEVVLVVGGDDQVWPSNQAARAIAARREAHGLATTVVEDPRAGHPGSAAARPFPEPGLPGLSDGTVSVGAR